jgi:hypothetical protein
MRITIKLISYSDNSDKTKAIQLYTKFQRVMLLNNISKGMI